MLTKRNRDPAARNSPPKWQLTGDFRPDRDGAAAANCRCSEANAEASSPRACPRPISYYISITTDILERRKPRVTVSSEQTAVRCVIMRGGTSKALYFHADDPRAPA
jgi:hypothetical protein